MKPSCSGAVWMGLQRNPGGRILDTETHALVERWILAFCEAPVLIDTELMRRVLDDVEAAAQPHNP